MKKKLLFITPSLPFPADSGGKIGTYSSLSYITKNFEVDLVTFCDDEKLLQEGTKILKTNGVKNIFTVEFSVKTRSISNIIKSILQGIPVSIFRNRYKKMFETVNKLLQEQDYDIIYADHWLMMQYVPKRFKGKVILKEHNAEYIMWQRSAECEKNFLKKAFLNFETKRIMNYEKKACNKADYVLTVTENDKESLTKIGANPNKIIFLPAIILKNEDFENNEYIDFDKRENSLLHVGTLSWQANVDGLADFLENVYPLVKQEVKEVKLYIIGKNPPEVLKKFAQKDPSIILTGFVENLNEYYAKCKIFIVPLLYGSGVKIKILHALAKKIPIVSTEVGFEGLEDLLEKQGGILAKNEKDFSLNIKELLTDNKKCELIAQSGLEWIKNSYSQQAYEQRFQKYINV